MRKIIIALVLLVVGIGCFAEPVVRNSKNEIITAYELIDDMKVITIDENCKIALKESNGCVSCFFYKDGELSREDLSVKTDNGKLRYFFHGSYGRRANVEWLNKYASKRSDYSLIWKVQNKSTKEVVEYNLIKW